jgi:hypothetical protein
MSELWFPGVYVHACRERKIPPYGKPSSHQETDMAPATACVNGTKARVRRAPKVLLVVTSLIGAGWTLPARAADAVTFWNEVANTASVARGPSSMLDMAKVHIAIHDAVQSFELRFEPYCATIPNATGSPAAAAAKAARDMLAGILPLTPVQLAALDATYNAFLTANGLVGNPGIATGQQAAACILQMRANDGSFPANPPVFAGEDAPGAWRPTATPPVNMATPWLGFVVPFALKDSTQLRPAPGPPALTSGLYRRDYDEVKAVGAKVNSTRTEAQTELANFYSDNFLVMMPRNLRTIAETMGTDLGENARLFALAHIAAADALISAWDAKLYYNFWRPVTAIHEGDDDGNRHTIGDPGWEPFSATPPYPDYTSGANNLTSSIMRIVERFFHTDKITFDVESKAAAATQKFRTYHRLSEITQDVMDVRVYQGIHFRFANEVAFRQGLRSADWTFSHVLRPIGGN